MAREPISRSFLKGLSLEEIAALSRIATRVQFKPGWSWLARPYKWRFSATAIDRVNLSMIRVADLRALFKRDPKLGYAVMERAAQTLLQRLQATRHKLRVYVKRASGEENSQQVC